jgi:hypothetical protein
VAQKELRVRADEPLGKAPRLGEEVQFTDHGAAFA